MEDMRKLMETVAPLFESYPDKDRVYDRYNDLSRHKDNPGVKVHLDKAQECWNNHDGQGCLNALKAGEALVAMKSEDGNDMMEAEPMAVDSDLERLQEIMDELENLGMEAKSLMVSIDPEKARTLDAYGAFNFGSSDNQYDNTFANAVGELVELIEKI